MSDRNIVPAAGAASDTEQRGAAFHQLQTRLQMLETLLATENRRVDAEMTLLQEQMAVISGRAAAQATQLANISQIHANQDTREDALERLRVNLEERNAVLRESQEALLAEEAALEAREDACDERELALVRREVDLDRREAALRRAEAALGRNGAASRT